MRPWYADTGSDGDNMGDEMWMARAKSVNNASTSDSGAEKMWLSAGRVASICIRRNIARLTKALGYDGFEMITSSSSFIAESIVCVLESLDARRIMSFCCVSKIESCDDEMAGCGGNVVSMAAASFDFATDDGSVSGSKSAFRMRASFADNEVLIVSIAIVTDAKKRQSRNVYVVIVVCKCLSLLVKSRGLIADIVSGFPGYLGFWSDFIWCEGTVRLNSRAAADISPCNLERLAPFRKEAITAAERSYLHNMCVTKQWR